MILEVCKKLKTLTNHLKLAMEINEKTNQRKHLRSEKSNKIDKYSENLTGIGRDFNHSNSATQKT